MKRSPLVQAKNKWFMFTGQSETDWDTMVEEFYYDYFRDTLSDWRMKWTAKYKVQLFRLANVERELINLI